jgi:hypothetical protein
MSGWVIQIDPPAVSSGRTMLDLNNGPIQVGTVDGGLGIDFGTAAITEYATQQGAWGNSVADYVIPNRTITISLIVGGSGYDEDEETSRTQLTQKVALLQREGGQLLRQRAGGPAMYADIVDAQLTLPDQYGETGDVEPNVQLVLTCIPDFYGDEITLDAIHSTGVCSSVLKQSGVQAVIEGDYPARCRLQVTDTSGVDQLGMLWGLRSGTYSSSSTAAVSVQAEAMTGINGTASVADASASGGHAMQYASGLVADTWTSILVTDESSAQLTHQGSYQVWARVEFTVASGIFRLLWGVGDASHYQSNDACGTLPSLGGYFLVDLGAIRVDVQPLGTPLWRGVVQAYADTGGAVPTVDQLIFLPLDDGAGQLAAVQQSNPQSASLASGEWAGTAATTGTNSLGANPQAWINPSYALGANDGQYASMVPTSHPGVLTLTGYGFAVPTSATITGIIVSVFRYAAASGVCTTQLVQLVKAGSAVGLNMAETNAWGGGASTAGYGGLTSLWGTTWTPAQINNTGFGVAIQAAGGVYDPGSNEFQDIDAQVDAVTIAVYYYVGTGFTEPTDAVVKANRVMEVRTEGAYRQDASGVWSTPIADTVGDLPRLPASGLEARPVELTVRPSQSVLGAAPDPSAVGTFTVTPIYRPCWLSRP